MMTNRVHAVYRVVEEIAIRCSPSLQLSDGRDILGLTRDQYDDFCYLMRRYYAGSSGALDPLPSGVGKATNYDRPGNKRHKPESTPPPRAADPDEPDWTMVRLAQAVEALPFLHQQLLIWRIVDVRSLAWCAEQGQIQQTERWASATWGRLVTRLYFRARGLYE